MHRLICTCIQRRVRISWVIWRWKSNKQARDINGRLFFRIALDETIANTYFLVPFYCFRHLIHCLEISGILGMRTIYEQFEAEIAKKLRTGQPQPKVTGSYKKKRVGLEIWLGLVLVLVVFP